ncbi:AraC family transcriptional regulator [Paraburkholderia caledonica]|uniref:AraC-like DNA-binding protein n=1 Tax=Paraburkholderia caledonica TaxID=134536 RepID=A0AB73IPS1_9BURK|nr:AraC-like DNA-binding protein [Paraburkholderia caledonica]
MDSVSEILASLSLGSSAIGTISLCEPWSLRFVDAPTVASYTVASGRGCWLRYGDAKPQWLEPGATVLLTAGSDSVVLCSGDDMPPTDIGDLFRRVRLDHLRDMEPDRPVSLNWGGSGQSTVLLGLAFGMKSELRHRVLSALPELIMFRADDPHISPWTAASLRFLARECANALPGYTAMARAVAETVLLGAVRGYLITESSDRPGWVRGLGDYRIAKALAAMHKDPGHAWTVAGLAAHAGMSRTAFAVRFAAIVGSSPIDYLTEWRVDLARLRLNSGHCNISRLAESLGYTSETAFRRVFKRICGVPPSQFVSKGKQATADGQTS